MVRGIYILANDKVKDNAIALCNSIRYYDPQVPIFLIPFNEKYRRVAAILKQKHGVQVFPDLDVVAKLTRTVGEIFDPGFLARPNQMRKLVQWFGPLDEFLYIDTDIVVFQPIVQILDYLTTSDFICCDRHYSGNGLTHIFSPLVRERGIFTEPQLKDVFNGGFWGSKKDLLSEDRLYSLLEECARHREYFDYSHQGTDQPLLNYIILKSTEKRLNLVKLSETEPGSWAGSKHFQAKDNILYDGHVPLKYLHWAGTPIQPGGPYWEIWQYYRYLGEKKPRQFTVLRELRRWFRKWFRKRRK